MSASTDMETGTLSLTKAVACFLFAGVISAAQSAGHTVAGSIAVLERGARLKKVADLRSVYLSLLDQGIRFDQKLLEESLARLGLAKLKP